MRRAEFILNFEATHIKTKKENDMRVVIQRAGHASVTINGTCKRPVKGSIENIWVFFSYTF